MTLEEKVQFLIALSSVVNGNNIGEVTVKEINKKILDIVRSITV